ncbi:MAG: PAS domain S-box [Methanobacterium sp. Maddingley MBC34]|nr:MAG: PAS domain S-box [Methanobacterium sp. Maddingley MBC34]
MVTRMGAQNSMTKILIVEDEAITAMDIKHNLVNFGFDVVGTAASGEKAIEIAQKLKPDLILMDITLKGDMDGIEAAKKIKTLFDIPVIYMSAFTDKNTHERLKLTNPYGFVSKPVSTELLVVSIEAAVYKHDLDKKLAESEERLRLIFDSSKDFIYSYDLEGRFTSANKHFCQATNLSEDEIIGKTGPELGLPEKQSNKWKKIRQQVYENNSTVEMFTSQVGLDKKVHEYEVILNPLHNIHGEIVGISGVSRDLTEHKLLKKELNELGELFQNLYTNAQVGIVIGDTNGHVLKCNSAFENMLGYSLEELQKMSFTEFTHQDYIDKELSLLESLRTGKIKFYEIEKKFIRKDKEITWGKVTGGFGISTDGKPVNSLIIVENIDDRKKSEKEILDYAAQLKAIFDMSGIALAATDTNGHWINVNEYFLNELGYTEEEFLKLTNMDVTHPDDLEKTSRLFSKLLSGELDKYRLEKRYKTKESNFKWFYLSVKPIKDENNKIIAVMSAGHPIDNTINSEELNI